LIEGKVMVASGAKVVDCRGPSAAERVGACWRWRGSVSASRERVAVDRRASTDRLRRTAAWHSDRLGYFDCSAVTPLELAIYAAEVKLIMTGLAFLAAVFFAAALLFAFFFGTVNPRLRRATRRGKRLRDENATLRQAIKSLRAEVASGGGKISALEKMVASFEREVHRLDSIRKRTDSSLVETKALLARLQEGKASASSVGAPPS
jgi:hypothetical protein